MEVPVRQEAQLSDRPAAQGPAKSPGPRPQRGQPAAPKPARRDPLPPRRLPGMDRSRQTVVIPQRRRM